MIYVRNKLNPCVLVCRLPEVGRFAQTETTWVRDSVDGGESLSVLGIFFSTVVIRFMQIKLGERVSIRKVSDQKHNFVSVASQLFVGGAGCDKNQLSKSSEFIRAYDL